METSNGKKLNSWLLLKVTGLFTVVAVIIVAVFNSSSISSFGKAQTGGQTCEISVNTSGAASFAAGTSGNVTFNATVTNCPAAHEGSIAITQSAGPTNALLVCYPSSQSNLGLPINGSASRTITCTSSPSTPQGNYSFKVTLNPSNHTYWSAVNATFSLDVTAAAVCTGYNLSTDKSSYNFGDIMTMSFSCASPTGGKVDSLKVEMVPPNNGTPVHMGYISNAGGGTYTFSTSSFTNKPNGSWLVRTCVDQTCASGTNSVSVNMAGGTDSGTGGNTTGGTASCTSSVGAVRPNQSYCEANESISCTNGYTTCTYTSDSKKICNPNATCPTGTTAGSTGGTTTGTTGSAKSCGTGERCTAGSWCQNGQQFYYPNDDLTCVSWGNDGTQPSAPAGTSECRSTDTNCVGTGQTVTYVSGKWCARGTSYYSNDGTKMTCVSSNTTIAPAGFSSCRPGDTQCIPSGGYGSSTGWCSNGMKFYQIAQDANANNDVYCAPQTYTAPGTTWEPPAPPAGYTACNPTDTTCKQKGDSWTTANSSNYCTNSQKCTTATGGTCVGMNETCPSGTKYCSATDNNCVEPGEYKTITNTGNSSGNSYWCGGSSGMSFYSSTQVYCAPKKAGNTMGMMFTSSDLKEIFAKLGPGWGVCSPNNTQCIEPGKTGSSSGWCGWYPPSATMMSPIGMGSSTGGTRTCPGLDGSTTTEPPKPNPDPIKVCPLSPSVIFCPPGQIKVEVQGPEGCGSSSYCKPDDGKLKPAPETLICPTVMEITSCQYGQILQKGTSPNGCSYSYCSTEATPLPIPYPYPGPGTQNQCRMVREENRGNKYEIRRIEQSVKNLPAGVTVSENLKSAIIKANTLYNEIEGMLSGTSKCTDALQQSARAKMDELREKMMYLRGEAQSVEVYRQCADFQKSLNERVSMLRKDSGRGRISFEGEIKNINSLLEKSKDICKAGDQFGLEDLMFDRNDIEQEINYKYNELSTAGRDSFVTDAIASIRDGMAKARAQMVAKGFEAKEQCLKIGNLFSEVEKLLGQAESSYQNGDNENAGSILDKIERFKGPVMEGAKQCGIDLAFEKRADVRDIYYGAGEIDDILIDRLVDKALSKFKAVLDEQVKDLTAKVAQLTETLQAKVQESLNALQSLPKTEAATKVKETKTAIIDTVATIQSAAKKLSTANGARLNTVFERAAKVNWCGTVAENVQKQAEVLKVKATENDIASDDIALFEQTLSEAEPKNNEECYKVGVSRFRDMDTGAWYYAYMQDNPFFKGGTDANGNATGRVEPARATLRAEALIAIERAMGFDGLEGTCTLNAKAQGVPAWANCAANVAAKYNVDFFGSMSQPATRDEVASWIATFANGQLPASGTSEYLKGLSDIRSCKANDAVSTMIANKIMEGYTGANAGKWGCGQPLLRVELGKVLKVFSDIPKVSR